MKFFTLIALCLLSLQAYAGGSYPKQVLMVINEGFQVDEYFRPRALFEQQGYVIKTASRFGGLVNPGRKYVANYNPVLTDMSFDQINIQDFDAITFAGGGGAWSDYFPDKTIHEVLIKAVKRKDMVVGLICASTGLLAMAHNLDGSTPQFKGRHVTGYGEVAGLLVNLGQVRFDAGDMTKPHVVVDENLVTGRDPLSSQLFGEIMIQRIGKN